MRKTLLIVVAVFAAAVATFYFASQTIRTGPVTESRAAGKTDRMIIYKYSWGEIIEQDSAKVLKRMARQWKDAGDLDVVVVEGTDYGPTLEIGLAAGDPIDAFLVGGNELGYWYRRGGVITPLNDLLDAYGPAIKKAVPARVWGQVTLDGRILSIPGYTEARGACVVVRGDILDRYGIPVPSTMEELERACARLLAVDPGIVPIAGAWWDFGPLLCPALGIEHWESHVVDHARGMIYTGNKLPGFYAFFETLQRWHARGYLDRDFLSSNFERIKQMFLQGKCVFVFNNVERTNDWARELGETDPAARVTVIPELNRAGVWSSTGEIPHHLIVSQYSANKERLIRYVNWVFEDPRNYQLAHLGVEGEHYTLQSHSFLPIQPVRYRGVYTPVANRAFSLPNAGMYAAWYAAIDRVQGVKCRTDVLQGTLFLDSSIERNHPVIDRFDQEWWKYIDGRLAPTAAAYGRTVALYFDGGGTAISREYYAQYARMLGKRGE